jgi:phosphate-selective porin OprO/OprP
MSSEIGGSTANRRVRASAKYASSIFIASSAIWLVSGSARADDSATLQKLEAHLQQLEERHESEIKALQAEIKRLRKEKPATTTVAATRPPATEPPPSSILPPGLPPPATPAKVLMTYDRGYHFGFSDATGENTVELFGRLQLDTGGYTNYNPGPETLDRKGLSDGVDLRRARIGVIGTFMSDWHYAFVYDFGNSSDSSNIDNALASANASTSPTTSNSFLSGVENAFITYNGFYSHGQQFPVAFDFGIMDVPWTLEEATSSNDLMFMERSSAQVIATTFGGGDFRSAIGTGWVFT